MRRQQEIARLLSMSVYEKTVKEQGYKIVAGVDEAGRGPLAGPVVAAACILPEDFFLPHLNDSKLLTPTLRKQLYLKMTKRFDIFYAVGIVDSEKIDEINILQATWLAMIKAIRSLSVKPDYVLFDGKQLPDIDIPNEGIVKGDSLSVSIAAASIIAKQTRDDLMLEYHKKYPQYGFDQHKGYGTKKHKDAIFLHGPAKIHRQSFEPIKSYLALAQLDESIF